MVVSILIVVCLFIREKYIQKHGDSYYRNVYLPNKDKFN